MISADLAGKTVLVTGGISGIGRAAVELFGRCGARVAVNYLPDDERAGTVLAEHAARRAGRPGRARQCLDPGRGRAHGDRGRVGARPA